jgi:exportin-T
MVIETKLPEPDTPDDDVLDKATKGKTYISDQLYLFEAAGNLVHATRNDAAGHIQLLEAVVGPLMSTIGSGLERYRRDSSDLQAVLEVHDHLLALGNFAKGFPAVSDKQLEALPYTPPFKQMTEALLQALEVMKTRRIVRDSVSYKV